MRSRRLFPRGRAFGLALGTLLFLLALVSTVLLTLPREAILSPITSALSARGVELSAEGARLAIPFCLRLNGVSIGPRGAIPISLDSLSACWEWTGLVRWLPFRLRAARGAAVVDVRTSPRFWNPGAVRLGLTRVGTDDLATLLPAGSGFGFLIEQAAIRWNTSSQGTASGDGTATLAWLRIPIPAPESPVREATLRDVSLKFAIRGGTLRVSSLSGTYEGSTVEGTGEIARLVSPSLSTITFHLRMQNPLEGRVATLFQMLAKNAKNANLRINGTLLSPTGEFQFF